MSFRGTDKRWEHELDQIKYDYLNQYEAPIGDVMPTFQFAEPAFKAYPKSHSRISPTRQIDGILREMINGYCGLFRFKTLPICKAIHEKNQSLSDTSDTIHSQVIGWYERRYKWSQYIED